MATEFQLEMQQPRAPLFDGEASSALDEAYMKGLCAGLSFRSLLTYGSFDPAAEARYLHNLPKPQDFFTMNAADSAEAPPFNFFLESEKFYSQHFQQQPELRSLGPPPHYTAGAHCNLPLNHGAETVSYGRPKRRRSEQKLSEKTRCLRKLLPWDKKMDMATVLEEAYKYIKFLQAQVSILQSMPPSCKGGGCGGDRTSDEIGEDLGRLNRQQLLQVVVNSPAAQAQLYTTGCCVFSIEQMVLLKKNAERKAFSHPMMLDSDPNAFFNW